MIKSMYIGIGTISLGIGIIGIVVPLLPTTPFLLLSAACYAKGSKRLYRWFTNMHWIGKVIQNYHEGKAITRNAKIISLIFLWTTILISMSFIWSNLLIRAVLVIVLVTVSIHILMLKTIRTDNSA